MLRLRGRRTQTPCGVHVARSEALCLNRLPVKPSALSPLPTRGPGEGVHELGWCTRAAEHACRGEALVERVARSEAALDAGPRGMGAYAVALSISWTGVDRPVVLVAAPAGFGKTTLLTQWLAASDASRATAWVTLDSGDNDPVRLWTYVAAALERAGCPLGPDWATFVAANAGEIETRVLPRLLTALASMPEDVVIVLDDFHFVREQACHDQVGFLVEHLPPQCHVLIATRCRPRSAPRSPAGQWPARRDPCRRPRVQRGRGDRSPGAATGPAVPSPRCRARGPHGGMAGGSVPRHACP